MLGCESKRKAYFKEVILCVMRSAGLAYLGAALGLGLGFWLPSNDKAFFVRLLTVFCIICVVMAVQSDGRAARSKTMRVGALLFLTGALGLVVNPSFLEGALRWFFLVCFVVGSTTYSAGFYHIDATSPWAKRIFIVGLVWGVFGTGISFVFLLSQVWILPVFICFWVAGLCWQGIEILTRFRHEVQ